MRDSHLENMKKFLCALCVLALGAGAFAERGRFSLDFAWGPVIGFQNIGLDLGVPGLPLPEVKLKRTDVLLPLVKINSYNFFLLDNMLGLHASLSFSPLGGTTGGKMEYNGQTVRARDSGAPFGIDNVIWGFEFLIGPSFGIDITEGIRFQTGLDFHWLFAREYFGRTHYQEVATDYGRRMESYEGVPGFFHSFGIGLTPQLWLNPRSKKVAFILGCDFIFDFGVNMDYGYFSPEGEESVQLPEDSVSNYFRFGINPYIGFGISL